MRTIFILLVLLNYNTSHAQVSPDATIKKILYNQVEMWNEGNIEAFMKGYWKNDSLLFVGKNGPTYGFNKTLSNYQKSYPDKATMGKLAFTILQSKPLSADTWFVLGKWDLTRTAGNVGGHFTLLFKKINNEWVIIADHSS